MRVLMLGWEFPPYFSGGLGMVCYDLSKALTRQGHKVTYLMPRGPEELREQHKFLSVRIAENEHPHINVKAIESLLVPYIGWDEYGAHYAKQMEILRTKGQGKGQKRKMYGDNLLLEAERFAQQALAIALTEEFDVIHAHDWLTFKAGIAIKEATGKPLLVHVHITEFDKSGGQHADPRVYAVEREGMMKADMVIAISNFVKNRCIHNYFIPPEKIHVIYNSMDASRETLKTRTTTISPRQKIVLSLGRVTLQKGPEYFLQAARKVVAMDPNVIFIMAGTGDLLPRMIELAAEMGIGNKVLFPGFTDRNQSDELFRTADLFVMPSVSEPFGLVPLEAMTAGTPVIISRQSGVSEIVHHALKVDFWDVDDLANKMLAALNYSALHETLKHHGLREIQTFTWDTPAQLCTKLYQEVTERTAGRKGWHWRFGGLGELHISGGAI